MSPDEIITEQEIIDVHGGADFGVMSKRDVVNQNLLKVACGYVPGRTAISILKVHGLIKEHRLINGLFALTDKGGKYLWSVFGHKYN